MRLPNETAEQRRAEATIGPADIARCKAWVMGFDGVVKYLDGKTVRWMQAKVLRWLWFTNEK